jgi:hypothetical protein
VSEQRRATATRAARKIGLTAERRDCGDADLSYVHHRVERAWRQ